MKLVRVILVSVYFLFFAVACKDGGTTKQVQQADNIKLQFPHNIEKLQYRPHLAELRAEVKKLIEIRQRGMREDISFFTYNHISPQYVSNKNKIDPTQRYDGYWLKFENDYTYSYGIYDNIIGGGIFHYTDVTQRLMMLDNDENIEPKMWTILSNSDFVNMTGRPLMILEDMSHNRSLIMDNFANDTAIKNMGKVVINAQNGMQMKMLLVFGRPKK